MNVNIAKRILKQLRDITNSYCTISQDVRIYTDKDLVIETSVYIEDDTFIKPINEGSSFIKVSSSKVKELDIKIASIIKNYKRVTKDL